jgi:uncharacterized protein YbaP (TraB family)
MRAQFRHWLIRFSLLFAAVTPAFAAEAPQPVIHATPAMWVVHGPRGTAYLLGSVHALPKNVEWQTPAIKAAFKKSNAFVFEVPMSEENRRDGARLFGANVFLPSSVALPSYFDAEMRKDFRAAVEHTGVEPEHLVVLRPWYAAMKLEDAMSGKTELHADEGVDNKIYGMATKRGVHDFRSFETAEFQLRTLKGTATTKNELDLLRAAMKRAASKPVVPFHKLLDAWVAGDPAALAEVSEASMSPEEKQTILDDRNKNWIPQIEKMLNEKRTFFITVGAAHLAGTDGVPNLLRVAGYRVEGP